MQALNEYTGAVVIVSHDRHMLEMTADRLVLVDGGVAKDFDGSLDDYIALVLSGGNGPTGKGASKADKKEARRAAAEARDKEQATRKRAQQAESEVAKLTAERSEIERAMFDPTSASPAFAKLTMTEMMKRRADLTSRLEAAEAAWLELSETLETA